MRIGIDLGGTKIAAALVSGGKIVRKVKVPTGSEHGKEFVLGQLRSVVEKLSKGNRITHIGIGVPGFHKGTRIVELPNLCELNGVDLKKALRLKANVTLANDADCFALGEHKFGAGKGEDRMVGLILGTGLGTGVIVENRLLVGKRHKAPEMTFLITDLKTTSLVPGEGGNAFESYLSGKSIVAWHKKRGGKEELASDIWKSRSRIAKQTRKEVSRHLAIYCSNIIRTFDPGFIILGGGAPNPGMVRDVNKLLPNYSCEPIVRLSKLKEKAAMLGAAYL